MTASAAVIITGVSPVYRFMEPVPFSGPDIYNPYCNLDTAYCWKRANFHTHTRVDGIFNECDYLPAEVYEAYDRFGYDIVTFSNHNRLTTHPFDSSLQVNVYEHGWNLLKYHKLVFGSQDVMRFDHLIPLTASQKQFQLNRLADDSDIIQINHPLRTELFARSQFEKIGGYRLLELDSGRSTENEYWDWALSAGRYCFGMANDDLHYPDRSRCIAVRCNFLCCPSAGYDDILMTLRSGCWYSMRIPDYGKGEWKIKEEKNRKLPYITDIGIDRDVISIALSCMADSIKVTGQGHTTLLLARNTDHACYRMKDTDPYARITAYFPEGEVIYTNPFARYDSGKEEMPACASQKEIDITLTILFNAALLFFLSLTVWALIRLNFKNGKKEE